MKSKRTQATSIPLKVKQNVWERDFCCCIFCGRPLPLSMACVHFISRAKSGLGIEENIGTGCNVCHNKLDQSVYRKEMMIYFKKHLDRFYPNFTDEERIYKKGM